MKCTREQFLYGIERAKRKLYGLSESQFNELDNFEIHMEPWGDHAKEKASVDHVLNSVQDRIEELESIHVEHFVKTKKMVFKSLCDPKMTLTISIDENE